MLKQLGISKHIIAEMLGAFLPILLFLTFQGPSWLRSTLHSFMATSESVVDILNVVHHVLLPLLLTFDDTE